MSIEKIGLDVQALTKYLNEIKAKLNRLDREAVKKPSVSTTIQLPQKIPYSEVHSSDQNHLTNTEAEELVGLQFRRSVKDKDLSTPPGSESDQDRYIIAGVGGGWSAFTANDIVTYDTGASAYTNETPSKGWIVYIDDEDKFYVFTTSWVELSTIINHDSTLNAYTDTKAIAAVEGEATLVLAGDVTILSDSKRLFLGAGGNDLVLYHSGTNSFIVNNTGILALQATSGGFQFSAGQNNVDFFTGSDFQIRDSDDSNVVLFELQTTGRVLNIGLAADPIVTDQNGDLNIKAGSFVMDGSGTDDEAAQIPYLSAAPATLANGMIWMESDGLHIYYAGAEKTVAGV